MKFIIHTFIIFLALIPNTSKSQAYIEVDPIAYALSGHSFHIGIDKSGFRFQIGTFAAEIPDSYKYNKEFDVYQSGYGFKLDYYGEKPEGTFIGVEYGKTVANYKLKNVGEKINRNIDLLGFRFGYKLMLGDLFFITPWIGIDKNVSVSKENLTFKLGEETYKESEWILFPTVHIGYEF